MRTASDLLKGWLSPNRYALDFLAGSSTGVDVANDATIDFGTGPFSFEFWFSVPAFSAGMTFIGKGFSGSGPGWGARLAGSNAISIWVGQGGGNANEYNSPASVPIVAGKLYHYVGVRGGGFATAYVNGVAGTPGTSTHNASNSDAVRIGYRSGPTGFLTGRIAGIRIYRRALSAAEVAQHYQGIYQDERGLALWLPGVEGSGSTIHDASGNENDGTLVNAPTWQFFDPFPNTMRRGIIADLYTFALRNGSFLRYTTLDADVEYDGNTFQRLAPVIHRDRVKQQVGIEVSTMRLRVYPRSGDQIGGVDWIPAARSGALDGALVTLQRAYLWHPAVPPIGVLTSFKGRVSTIQAGRSGAEIEVKSYLEVLNIPMPRNLVQPGCIHTLYDVGCTLNRENFAEESEVEADSTRTVINCNLTQDAGYFDLGAVTFTSGVNSGVSRGVKSYTPGVLTLSFPLPSTPETGDEFTAYPGCDKKQGTCTNKFNNLPNFKAMPFVPVPETAV